MDAHQETFNQSYWRTVIAPSSDADFFGRFYERFIASSPEVGEKFRKTDMSVQMGMLRQSMARLPMYYREIQADEYLEHLAMKHSKYDRDIPPRLYDLWLECLIDTVRESDPEFSDTVERAWRTVLKPGIDFMKAHYDG